MRLMFRTRTRDEARKIVRRLRANLWDAVILLG
jgi:hypothetical protein